MHKNVLKLERSKCLKQFERKDNHSRHEKVCLAKMKSIQQCSIVWKCLKSDGWHMSTDLEKNTFKCNSCGVYVSKEDSESHSILCNEQRPISSNDLDEDLVTMVEIERTWERRSGQDITASDLFPPTPEIPISIGITEQNTMTSTPPPPPQCSQQCSSWKLSVISRYNLVLTNQGKVHRVQLYLLLKLQAL